MLKRGDWAIEASSQTPCQVVDVEEVWGARSYRVWLPTQATVLRVAEPRLVPFHTRPTDVVGNELAFVSAAARIADGARRSRVAAARCGAGLVQEWSAAVGGRAVAAEGAATSRTPFCACGAGGRALAADPTLVSGARPGLTA